MRIFSVDLRTNEWAILFAVSRGAYQTVTKSSEDGSLYFLSMSP